MRGENKVLITGCGGMLGAAVYEAALKKYGAASVMATDIDLNEPWLSKLDVRNIDEFEKVIIDWRPNILIHLAALTDLEYCENNPDKAWVTNALGAENAALLAQKHSLILVHISTAGVFDGNLEEYTDFDTPNPLGYYAKSKFYAEKFIEQHLQRYYIFRAGWMMGGGLKKDKKFINKIYKQIKNGAKELFVVDDKLGTPTYTNDFANSMFRVVDSGYFGLYNQVCGGSCSRLDVAKEFINLLGLKDTVKVTKVRSDYFKDEYFAPRPVSEKLVNLKLIARNMNYMRDWRECLAKYSQEFKDDFYGEV